MKKVLFIFVTFLCFFMIACNKTNDEGGGKDPEPVVEDIIITYVTNCEITLKSEKLGDDSLQALTREGYVFEGWYMDSEFKTKANVSLIQESTTVYAKWSEVKITVKIFNKDTLLDVVNLKYNESVDMSAYLVDGLKFVSADKAFTNIKEDIELHCEFEELQNALLFIVGEDKIEVKLVNPNLIGIQLDFKFDEDAEFGNVLPKASVNKKGNEYSFIYSNQKNVTSDKSLFTLSKAGEVSDLLVKAYVREDSGEDININPVTVEYYIIK